MKASYLFLLVVFSIALLGCAQTQTGSMENDVMVKKESSIMEKDPGAMTEKDTGNAMEKEDSPAKEPMMGSQGYSGKLLAGTASKYLEFSKADYEKALNENKKILLYFYANWCPLCKAEQPETFAAFNEIDDADLVGFRVNYRDSDTDADEETLAKEFGIGYQHTKVILKGGQRAGKWPDSWDKQRYMDELAKV